MTRQAEMDRVRLSFVATRTNYDELATKAAEQGMTLGAYVRQQLGLAELNAWAPRKDRKAATRSTA